MSRYNHLFACSCECHVQFAVDNSAVFLKAIGGEEVQLVAVSDGERIDNDIPLRPLIAFNGVDGDAVQLGDTQLLQLATYHRNLVSVRNDDANSAVRIEVLAVKAVDAPQYASYDARLGRVSLV